MIAPVSGNAYAGGFLDAAFANSVIDSTNRLENMKVALPPGFGTGQFVVGDKNIILDLTKMSIGTPTNFGQWLDGVLVYYSIPATYVGPI